MGKKRKEPSHEEIWDDSGLIDSWNASLDEYKRYHSIYLRGGSLEEILSAAESEAEDAAKSQEQGIDTANGDDEVDTKHGNEWEGGHVARLAENHVCEPCVTALPTTNQQQDAGRSQNQPGPNVRETQAAGTFPGLASGSMSARLTEQSSDDPSLKKLMMAWYWAGYYSGFHEGQQATKKRTDQSGEKGA